MLHHCNFVIILNCVKFQNWGIDSNLSRKQCADVLAYTSLMNERLIPALVGIIIDSYLYL